MADVYDRAKATATRMLAPRSAGGKGLELTLRRTVPGEYDPTTGTSVDTVIDYLASGFRENYKQADIDGSVIRVGDVKFLISPVLIDGSDIPEPKTQEVILFDGDTYTVQHVEPWNYAGLAVGFAVQARK